MLPATLALGFEGLHCSSHLEAVLYELVTIVDRFVWLQTTQRGLDGWMVCVVQFGAAAWGMQPLAKPHTVGAPSTEENARR